MVLLCHHIPSGSKALPHGNTTAVQRRTLSRTIPRAKFRGQGQVQIHAANIRAEVREGQDRRASQSQLLPPSCARRDSDVRGYPRAQDPDAKCIFWLSGITGTGKSTISRTTAQAFADQGQLSASFFFKRGEHDRGNAILFVTTITCDLVHHIPKLLPHVHKAINDEPRIARKSLKEQFDKLIFQPVTNLRLTGPRASLSW
jgi:Mrp family chromosome partitioning ATPase